MHIDHQLTGAGFGIRDVANKEGTATRPVGDKSSPRHCPDVTNPPAVRGQGKPDGCLTLPDLQLGDLRFSDVSA
jgi:hypothetical protein